MDVKESKRLPVVHQMPRVVEDIDRCIGFVAQQPWGKPDDRCQDILKGIEAICEGPELNEVSARRRATGLKLRRHNVAQFAIIYAYVPPSTKFPKGVISIRAVRHAQARDVFRGVKEAEVPPYNSFRHCNMPIDPQIRFRGQCPREPLTLQRRH